MTSQDHKSVGGSGSFYHQALEELDAYLQDPSYTTDHCVAYDGGNLGSLFSVQTCEQHCTIETCSGGSGSQPFYSSPSTHSFSSNGSCNTQLDSISDTNNNHPQNNLPLAVSTSNHLQVESLWSNQAMENMQEMDLKEMLIACAKAVADYDIRTCEFLMSKLRLVVSVNGEPLQRLGAYMLEGLVARFASSGSSIYKSLKCKEPTSTELLSYMHLLYEVCPYFKFGYLSANGAIAEAMKNEKRIHIIDFQIAQGTQWISLIQALAARPGGAPHVRITGIDDSFSALARGGGLEIVGQRLSRLANSCGVPFEFNAVAMSGCDIETKHLRVHPGEALGINFAMMLHHMPDESVCVENHRDRLLRMVKSLSPKVVTLVEQDSNTNTAPFLPRFCETLEYYLAIFDSIDVALSREHKERINIEQHCLARDIVNVIACEGLERVERHELLGKWRLRLAMAGFKPLPLSSFVNATIKTLLENYSHKYTLVERDGCLFLGWMNRDLVGSCAWI